MAVTGSSNNLSLKYDLPAANSRFIWMTSMVAALGGLLFGFDTAIISGTIPYISFYFGLDAYALGWAVSSILIGCGLGALIAGKLADACGRKFVLKACAIVFALSAIGVAIASSLPVFIAFRVIGGLGVGAAAMVSPMYVAEITPAARRGKMVALYQLAIVTGILLAYYVNYLFDGIGVNNWRWMFASQTAPAALFWIMLLKVPDTPRWLVKKNRTREAMEVLERTAGTAYAENELKQILLSFQDQQKTRIAELFSPLHRPIVLMGILIAVFQQVTGINAILYYAPVIFKETGINSSGSLLQTIGIGCVNVLATFIAIGWVDKIGRKPLLLYGSVCMAISLLVVGLCFHYRFFDYYIVLLFMIIYVGAFGATLGAVTWIVLSEIFPNRIRGLALSAATIALWMADFVVAGTFPVLSNGLGTSATLYIYAAFCVLSFVYTLLIVPETKGRSLEEIERSLTGKN
jgi:SP family arabinose:H+ symporter-like MFS transporter